jgi:APA family basic amino acid/polyamine antiporter
VIALSWSRSIPGLPGDPLWWAVGLVVICGLLLGLTGGGESHEKKWQILAFLVGSSVAIKVVMLLVTTTAGFVEGRFVLVGHGGDPSGWQLFGAAPAFSVLYFSFIGFDAPSTAAEDARYPQRDLASSILLSLTIVSVLYFVFAMSGGGSSTLPGWVTEWGAALGRPSGVFVLLYGQRQILLAVWRDELLGRWGSPPGNEAADRSWRWESFASVAVSVLVSGLLVKGFNFDDSRLTMFVNVATGTAFAIVALGTGVLRVRRPDLPRTFTAPFLPVAVLLAIASSCVLLVSTRAVLPAFGIWVGVGAVVYLVVLTARLRG